MLPQVFEINLDQEPKRFFAGQVITGRVIIILHREKAVKGVMVRLIGKGVVTWEAGISGLKYSHNSYRDTEVYIDSKLHLLSRDDGREQLLEAGRHDYPFSIQVPPNIPSTFDGQHGFIQYMLEASIQRSWKDTHFASLPIEIRAPIDLNAEPKAAEPVKIFKEKHVGLMLCQNGPLIVNVLLSKAGFIPGEFVQFGVEIRNNANIKISSVIVSLRKHITYKVGTEKKSQTEKVVQCAGPSVEMRGCLIWQNHFQIPDLPPNPLTGCKLMDLNYYIEIKLVLERWTDLKICTPIVIGAIPYTVPEAKGAAAKSKLAVIEEEPSNNHSQCDSHSQPHSESDPTQSECLPLINNAVDNPEYTLPLIDWGSSACLAEIEKITSRPVQTVPSFLLSASENLYAMSMGSCDKLSTNYEILDDRHILFEDDDAFVDLCTAQLHNFFLRDRDDIDNSTRDFYG